MKTKGKHYKRGTLVFWGSAPEPWWVVEWNPDNGPGAYWIVDAEGTPGVACPDELSMHPAEHSYERKMAAMMAANLSS